MKIFVGYFTYHPKFRSFLVDLLKPLIPEKNLKKYHLTYMPLEIIHNGNDSDCYLLPYSWNYYVKTDTTSVAEQLISEAQANGKKILIWVIGDYYYSIPRYDNIIGLYTSPYQSKQKVITISLPVIIQDPLSSLELDTINLRDFNEIPTVGFCGQSDPNLIISFIKMVNIAQQNIKYYLHLSKYYSGPAIPPTYLRKKVLDILDKTDKVRTEFIRRNRYQKGRAKEEDSFKRVRKEFYKNIENTDYTLCIRGTGNFSARFYETLALGRIPIFINTDCMLPFNDVIDWKKHVIWIEQSEILDIKTKILDFHTGLTQDSFTSLQKKNRHLWEEYFIFPGFIYQLISHLKKELNQ